jgi:hypothetical protein
LSSCCEQQAANNEQRVNDDQMQKLVAFYVTTFCKNANINGKIGYLFSNIGEMALAGNRVI